MTCYRHHNSPKNKEKRRKRAQAGGKAKFLKYRENTELVRRDPPADIYELRFTNFLTGEVKTLLYHPGDRVNNFSIDVNDVPWKTCGINESLELLGKSMYKLQRR